MIELVTKSGKRIGKISDDKSQDDIFFVDGKPVQLSDIYNDEELKTKINDEIKKSNGIKLNG